MNMLAIIGFALIILLMYVLITEKMAPPVAFIIFPIIAAFIAGSGISEVSEFIGTGLETVLDTAVLFLFSISYFTLMSEQGLFDPMVDWVVEKVGKNIAMIFLAVLVVVVVAHLDGSGASSYLITIPAFKPIMDRLKVEPTHFLGTVIAMMSAMNIIPWGGPTIRAATVAGVEVFDLYKGILPAVMVMFGVAIAIALFYANRTKAKLTKDGNMDLEGLAGAIEEKELPVGKSLYMANLVLTVVMLACLFLDIGLPMHFIFMLAFAIALVINFKSVKEQNAQIKHYGVNAINMTMTLFAVGIFMGVIQDSGMVDAMATSIINLLPDAFAPHMHWFIALFSVPLMMVLGTDAFYYAMLPIVIGIVGPFGITPEQAASTLLITGTYGTYISPTVAANYVGVTLAGTTIGEHIRKNLPIMWASSIVVLILATLLGAVPF